MTEADLQAARAALAEQRPDKAVRYCAAALANNRDDPQALHLLGLARHAVGASDEAADLLTRALAQCPDDVELLSHLGTIEHLRGQLDAALRYLQRAHDLAPDAPGALLKLGNLLRELRRFEPAEQLIRRVIALVPDHAEAHNYLGIVQLEQQRFDLAEAAFERAIQAKPDEPAPWNNRGIAMRWLGRPDIAAQCFRTALDYDPEFVQAYDLLGLALQDLGRENEAIIQHRAALERDPDNPLFLRHLGLALRSEQYYEDAEAILEQSRALAPHDAATLNALAGTLRAQGRFADARAIYREAIRAETNPAPVLRNLVAIQGIEIEPEDTALIEQVFATPPTDAQSRMHLIYVHAALAARENDHARAFEHTREANRLRRDTLRYDVEDDRALFATIKAGMDESFLARLRHTGDPSSQPLFIVGMPRSGSSLVEQILASHPDVHGAGELPDLNRLLADLHGELGHDEPFPYCLDRFDAAAARRLGAAYVARVRHRAPAALRIVDKMLANFRFLGAIAAALPNARVIHCRRDPRDTCLSCFMTYFRAGQPFTYDLEDLGRYYRCYQDLMEHWRAVLTIPMLEVDYENLVSDSASWSRKLVAFAGLPWHDACLDFSSTERPVATASEVSVRQPIYGRAVGRWRSYESQLRPLLDILDAPARH